MKKVREVVGLIPAAGEAKRIAPLPCSKEIFPLGLRTRENHEEFAPTTACDYLLDKMHRAGIRKAYIVLRKGKWDIPAYLCQNPLGKVELAYLALSVSAGVPYTIDHAYPFLKNSVVAFGFPDIVFHEYSAFDRLLHCQQETGCHVVLGLFPADNPVKVDMVELAESGAVRDIIVKPHKTSLTYTWGIAVWSSAFTQFMHDVVCDKETRNRDRELFVGDILREAIRDGLRVEGVRISDEPFVDIGTPADLRRMMKVGSE